MNIAYNCKFCSHEGVVTVEDEPTVLHAAERFKPMLCCNRCGKFMEGKRRLTDPIRKACSMLAAARITLRPESVASMEPMIRSKLEELTKRYARLVCDYLRVTNVWEPDFVHQLMEYPDKHYIITDGYLKGMKHAAAQSHAQQNA